MYVLYKNERQEEGDEEVTLSMYRHIFNHEYNFSFHVPKNTVKNQQNKFKYAPRIEPNDYKYVSYFRPVAI